MTDTALTLYDAFRARRDATPDAAAVIFPEMAFSYAKMDRLAQSFASALARHGVGPGSLVHLRGNEVLTQLAMLLACGALNARVVQDSFDFPVPDSLTVTHRFHVADPAVDAAVGSVAIDGTWSPSQMTGPVPALDAGTPDDEWLYVYTSGTTGVPKFVPLTQAMVCLRSYAVAEDFKAGETRFATTMPVHGRAFLARGLAALLNGATILGGTSPQEWAAAGATMISGSVAQMTSRFRNCDPAHRFPVAEVFGSRLSEEDALLLLRSFDEVHDVFGATETNKAFVNLLTLGPDGALQRRGRSVSSEIEIVDREGTIHEQGQDGNLRVRNDFMAAGYVGDDDATATAFRDGWFYSGDAASWGPDGTLRIRARVGHVFNIRGTKMSGFLVDQVIRSVDGIRDAVAFQNPKPGAPEELFAFVVYDDGANQVQAAEVARLECEERLGEAMVPVVIQGVAGIPRKDDGTVDREDCQRFILQIRHSVSSDHPE